MHNYKGGNFRLRLILITATATSLLLTLLILPLVYEKFGVKIEKHEDRR